jgi:effector-binding domain-containing protein
MDYRIEIEALPEQPYVALEFTCSPSEFERKVEQTLTEVWSLLDGAGVPPVGPPFCLVPQIESLEDEIPPASPWRLVCGFPVEDELEAEEPVRLGILPGGKVLTTMHKGRLDTLSTAYLALQVHIVAKGLVPRGSPWEVYLTDPVWEPDPDQWRTIVRWAIE